MKRLVLTTVAALFSVALAAPVWAQTPGEERHEEHKEAEKAKHDERKEHKEHREAEAAKHDEHKDKREARKDHREAEKAKHEEHEEERHDH